MRTGESKGGRFIAPLLSFGRGALIVALAAWGAEAADPEAGRQKAAACATCHGPDGNATAAGTPSLAGMPPFYTHWQLNMYRDGRRRDPQMAAVVDRLSDADLADLSAYYAAQAPKARPAPVDPGRIAAGRPLAQTYHCTSCHGPALMGQQAVPRLAGQDFDYLSRRLRAYKARTSSDLDGVMTMTAQPLSEADIDNLVHFIATLGVER